MSKLQKIMTQPIVRSPSFFILPFKLSWLFWFSRIWSSDSFKMWVICHSHLLIRHRILLGFWTQKSRIQIWLYEQSDLRIEGQIIVRASSIFSAWLICATIVLLILDDNRVLTSIWTWSWTMLRSFQWRRKLADSWDVSCWKERISLWWWLQMEARTDRNFTASRSYRCPLFSYLDPTLYRCVTWREKILHSIIFKSGFESL